MFNCADFDLNSKYIKKIGVKKTYKFPELKKKELYIYIYIYIYIRN